ncbi:MAG: DUF6484 domain-containing protein [Azoarcus sp.]|nr:DUF6484 domain-containing protein [Azoarcus sp.]
MKTEVTVKLSGQASSPENDTPGSGQDSTLQMLLRRPATNIADNDAHAGGIRLGTLQGFDEQGRARVQIDGLARQQTCVGALVRLQTQDLGRRVALGFENGSIHCPIVLGLLAETAATVQITGAPTVDIERHPGHTVIEAEGELELRCGEAVILLQADGRIQLRGTYITSHASASQRIRGGSVQIN